VHALSARFPDRVIRMVEAASMRGNAWDNGVSMLRRSM
jgi:hypothetical protein